MDSIDRKILYWLQRDATLSIAELADKVGLSSTPCWRRVQVLERDGVIARRVALADPGKLNLGVTVFVRIKTSQHSHDWVEQFASAVDDIPEIIEFHRMSGDIDYLLKIVVPDIAGYDAVYQQLIAKVSFADVSANFAMETIKSTTALPVDHAN